MTFRSKFGNFRSDLEQFCLNCKFNKVINLLSLPNYPLEKCQISEIWRNFYWERDDDSQSGDFSSTLCNSISRLSSFCYIYPSAKYWLYFDIQGPRKNCRFGVFSGICKSFPLCNFLTDINMVDGNEWVLRQLEFNQFPTRKISCLFMWRINWSPLKLSGKAIYMVSANDEHPWNYNIKTFSAFHIEYGC